MIYMNKKNLFILLLVMCVGYFAPIRVFAVEVNNYIYNNIDIDYRFFVDEEKDQEGKKKFRLYDNSNILNFESEYNSATHEYLFNIKNENYEPFDDYGGRKFYGINSSSIDFPAYVRDYNMIAKFKNNLDMEDYILNHRVHGFCKNDEDSYNIESPNCSSRSFSIDDLCNYYDFIPMILEDTISGKKRIVFASFNLYSSFSYYGYMMCKDKSIYKDNQSNAYYAGVYLYNHLNLSDDDLYLLDSVYGLSFENNIKFMRNAMYDYSNELWEELNNEPIASSEIHSNNKASANYKYVNQSIIGGIRNVPEETLEDYASSLPVLSFKKADSIDNNIVNVVTNPKTWNNGIVILVISMIVVIGSGFVLIKRKSN